MKPELAGDSENFRRAVAWLVEQPAPTWETIEQASQLFSLAPVEAAVLFRYFSTVSPSFIIKTQ